MHKNEILQFLAHTSEIYSSLKGPSLEITICGGTALNLSGLLERPTKDVDVVSPEIWPAEFIEAVDITTSKFDLKPGWINKGPIDLLRMGLPEGFFDRCEKIQFHPDLTYLITSRYDQIHFKLYACVDRGGYHVQDLKSLNPNEEEIFKAALWTMTHDVSEGFRTVLISFLQIMGWPSVAERLNQ